MTTIICIMVLAGLSYWMGIRAIMRGDYRPNLFSRLVWLGLALNSLASVVRLGNETPTVALAAVAFLGALAICIGSIFRGQRSFGRDEIIASVLLLCSLIFWLVADLPLLNLFIGLIAHLIGSLPTVVRVIKRPESENVPFWLLFALASLLALIVTHTVDFKGYVYLVYYAIFDSGMTLLSLRKYKKGPSQLEA